METIGIILVNFLKHAELDVLLDQLDLLGREAAFLEDFKPVFREARVDLKLNAVQLPEGHV